MTMSYCAAACRNHSHISGGRNSKSTPTQKKLVSLFPYTCCSAGDIFHLELWHIFHDELDLDGNGRLDMDELDSALKNSGEQDRSKSFGL